jgi:hypothetical protein
MVDEKEPKPVAQTNPMRCQQPNAGGGCNPILHLNDVIEYFCC